MSPTGDMVDVIARVPLSELFTYANEVRSLSQGRAAAGHRAAQLRGSPRRSAATATRGITAKATFLIAKHDSLKPVTHRGPAMAMSRFAIVCGVIALAALAGCGKKKPTQLDTRTDRTRIRPLADPPARPRWEGRKEERGQADLRDVHRGHEDLCEQE